MEMEQEVINRAKKKAWEMGCLTYKMRPPQYLIKEAWIKSRDYSRKFYIESTRRLGKSSFLLLLFTEECLLKGNRKCGFFAPVKEGLLDYVEPLIAKTFDDCPDEIRPVFDKQRFMLKFNNGSAIIFRGSNNQQHRIRRGQEFNIAGIDEARDVDNLTELIESVVFPSLFSTDGYMIISSTPADTRSHPLFGYRQQAEIENWLIRIPMSEANRLDPENYSSDRIEEWKKETLKAVDGDDIWKREYECEWVINRKKMAVPEWKTEYVNIFSRDPYYSLYHHYVGIDWGYKDFTAIVFSTWNFRKARLEVDGELTFQGKEVRSDLISDAINLKMLKLWGKDANIWRQVSDSADPILINELNKFDGMGFVPVQKLNSLEAMLNEFRVLVNEGKIVVDPTCQMTIHNLETAVWNDKRTKLDQDIFSHHFDHLMALVYTTRVLDQQTNPIPKDYFLDGMRVIDINFDKTTATNNSGRSLEGAFRASARIGR
jgi:hypothetical protein